MLHTEIPSPSVNGFHVGALYIHYYGVMYLVGITVAVLIARRRWAARGGNPAMVEEMAIWGVPSGIIGGRIYFDITTPAKIQPHWYGPLAVWDGGLGIWGAVALATVVCIWRLRRAGASVADMMDSVAPGLLIAQGIGRIGNYFNQELFGKPTTWPWGLAISPAHRPPGFSQYATFQPTFLYELIWDVSFALFMMWIGKRGVIRPGGLFPLYVAGYSAFRIFEETVRIDYSQYILGLRLNFFVAIVMTLVGLAWFVGNQHRRPRSQEALPDPTTENGGPATHAAADADVGDPADDQPEHAPDASAAEDTPAATAPPTG